MPRTEEKPFLLAEMPNYVYPLNLACPECYKPLDSIKRHDGRCDECLKSKKVLPINYKRKPKRKVEEDDEYDYVEED